MGEVFAFLGIAAFTALPFLLLRRLARIGGAAPEPRAAPESRMLTEAARALALERTDGGYRGERGGFGLVLQEGRVIVDFRGRKEGAIPSSLEILPRAGGSERGEGTTTTGDASFDRGREVAGSRIVAAALLGHDVRDFLAKRKCRVAGGLLILEENFRNSAGMVKAAGEAMAVAGRMARSAADIAGALARNAMEDPVAEVALRNLDLLLAGDRTGHPDYLPTLRSFLDHRLPQVRLRAARALGDEGKDVLEGLVFDVEVHEDVRAEALSSLASSLPPREARALLHRVFRHRGEVLTAAALAEASRLGDFSSEPFALDALRSPLPGVRLAAVDCLAGIGSAAAVAPLRLLADESGVLDFELRGSVERAVSAVQSRLQGAAAGQVSLAGGDAGGGRVSLAGDDREGRLSEADAPRERNFE